MIDILLIYYSFVLVLVGVIGSLTILADFDILEENLLKIIFMYQYVVYELSKENLNIFGIIILEIITTFSVWFLNILIVVAICVYYVLWTVCKLFYFIFRKRHC